MKYITRILFRGVSGKSDALVTYCKTLNIYFQFSVIGCEEACMRNIAKITYLMNDTNLHYP